MKLKNYSFILAMAFVGFLTSCETAADDESCDGEDLADIYCEQLEDVSLIATFCSDGIANSYYTYNGVDYQCTGIEANTCDDALAKITTEMKTDEPECFGKKSTEVADVSVTLSKMAKGLLLKVKNNSIQ